MKNLIRNDNDFVTFALADTPYSAGDVEPGELCVFKSGNVVGVAVNDNLAANNARGFTGVVLQIRGTFTLTKTADTDTYAVGDTVWVAASNASGAVVKKTPATGDLPIGIAVASSASGVTTVQVYINDGLGKKVASS